MADNIELVFMRDEPPELCGGGVDLESCPTAQDLLKESAPFVPDRVQGSHEDARWHHLLFLARDCGECALRCHVAVVVQERRQTGTVKLIYKDIT